MQAVAERRAATRVLHEVAVSFSTQNTFYTGLTCDVSTGGVFVATSDLLPRGTIVRFELTLGPRAVRVPMTGIVRWVRSEPSGDLPAGIGVQWLDLQPRLRRLVEEFVSQRGSLYFDDEG